VFLRGMARQGLGSEMAKTLAPLFSYQERKEKPIQWSKTWTGIGQA
jgi:hypothetical protein